jgi:hypothetical protein
MQFETQLSILPFLPFCGLIPRVLAVGFPFTLLARNSQTREQQSYADSFILMTLGESVWPTVLKKWVRKNSWGMR